MYLEKLGEMPDIWHGLKFNHDNCYGNGVCDEIITIGSHKHNLSQAVGDSGTKTELDSAYYISTKKYDYLIIGGCFFIPNKNVCAFINWLVFQDPTQKQGFCKFYE